MILPAGSSVCTLRNVFKKSFLQSCMPSNIIENSRHPFPDHLLSLYHIYLLLCSIKVLFYFFRFHASHVFLVLYDFILLAIFLEVCIIFHAVRWVNLGIMICISGFSSPLLRRATIALAQCAAIRLKLLRMSVYTVPSSSPQLPLLRRST